MPDTAMGCQLHPDDPTVADIALLLGNSYLPEGVVRWLHANMDRVGTREGWRHLYDQALALNEGVFS